MTPWKFALVQVLNFQEGLIFIHRGKFLWLSHCTVFSIVFMDMRCFRSHRFICITSSVKTNGIFLFYSYFSIKLITEVCILWLHYKTIGSVIFHSFKKLILFYIKNVKNLEKFKIDPLPSSTTALNENENEKWKSEK